MTESKSPRSENEGSSLLVEEVRTWNTPLVGAFQLWQFTQGYCDAHPKGDAPIGLLHFIAGPMLSSPQLSETISNRRKSLQSYALGFEDKKCIDILLGLQRRIHDRRRQTLDAIDVAICSGLLVWDTETGKLYPTSPALKPKHGLALRSTLKREGEKAKILGSWFSAHDLSAVAAYLKVVL